MDHEKLVAHVKELTSQFNALETAFNNEEEGTEQKINLMDEHRNILKTAINGGTISRRRPDGA